MAYRGFSGTKAWCSRLCEAGQKQVPVTCRRRILVKRVAAFARLKVSGRRCDESNAVTIRNEKKLESTTRTSLYV